MLETLKEKMYIFRLECQMKMLSVLKKYIVRMRDKAIKIIETSKNYNTLDEGIILYRFQLLADKIDEFESRL